MTVLRAASWGLAIHKAGYYGWALCLHVGPWLVFCFPVEPRT